MVSAQLGEMAEVLTLQGDLAEAKKKLQETLPNEIGVSTLLVRLTPRLAIGDPF